jgi:hypothetical protein
MGHIFAVLDETWMSLAVEVISNEKAVFADIFYYVFVHMRIFSKIYS